ncbi:hypothetical protein [Tautonia sociabilis]|uniref:hypothetical protein n=1 Tax=Tautonia sociabilis TaxID=2080755 RepID=UPI0013151D52|nr:hypothetical protein [Tautonia sociabilis]
MVLLVALATIAGLSVGSLLVPFTFRKPFQQRAMVRNLAMLGLVLGGLVHLRRGRSGC